MSTQFINTNALEREPAPFGKMTEVLNEQLAGAKNVKAFLRWVDDGQTFDAAASDRHQLVYFVEGDGSIHLDGKDYDVRKGGGVYLRPSEGASVTAKGGVLKLFHLVVPQIPA